LHGESFFGSILIMVELIEPIELHTVPEMEMTHERFFEFCQANREYRIERKANGDILIMSPESASSGHGNARLARFFDEWAEANGSGTIFGSSAGFILPNGAMRSPDLSWVRNDRLKSISDQDWNKFLPLCPDFVLELRSPSDRPGALQEKMREYIANGAQLGWLLDPVRKQIHIYRAQGEPEILDNPNEVSGDPVLPGFRLPAPRIWSAMNRPV
jgi:Uma2 family endonuclease